MEEKGREGEASHGEEGTAGKPWAGRNPNEAKQTQREQRDERGEAPAGEDKHPEAGQATTKERTGGKGEGGRGEGVGRERWAERERWGYQQQALRMSGQGEGPSKSYGKTLIQCCQPLFLFKTK